ncbi:DUF4203 domain-containing protein [Cellulomonas edaphi]|uniref:DUF4203 domain-containing protein n=1 Tax=Cellulomonas edaphi TaxID=3053468 RepID=A0ABT7S5Z9_9CELL|nr:DUF4203 domain-containing protein [Cellulomons edaphi]MDM7830404.1 DUF4203 domain-containing protein [Cellulomons edaphi]
MVSGLIVVAVGLVLCFGGIVSINLALLASGFGGAYLLAEAFGATDWDAIWVAVASAVIVWLVAMYVFHLAPFVIGAVTGAVIGAKLWAALGNRQTNVLLSVVLVLAVAAAAAMLADRFGRRVILWTTALGGASVAMTGVAVVWPEQMGALDHPEQGWQQTVMFLVWICVAGTGWYVQRRFFGRRLQVAAAGTHPVGRGEGGDLTRPA